MHTMTEREHKAERIDLKALVGGNRDFLRQMIRATLQEMLEAEMTEAWGRPRAHARRGAMVIVRATTGGA
jgi:transposase-like protein